MKKALDSISTLIMVLVVSALVWLYAEDANVQQYPDFAISIEFQPPPGRDMVVEPQGERVTISFSGSNGQYQKLQRRIIDRALVYPLRFDPDDPTPSVSVNMRQFIEAQLLRELGINLDEVEPRTVTVEGEVIETVAVNVILDARGKQLVREDIRQKQIEFTVPHRVAQQLRESRIVARLTDDNIEQLVPGQDTSLRVPLLPVVTDDGQRLRPTTNEVDVVVRLADNIARTTVDRRAVLLSYPPSLNQRFVLELDEQSRFVTNLEMEGPREQIEAIKQASGNELVWATVKLTNEEVETAAEDGGTIAKTVEIVAPQSVRLVSEPIRVTVRVQQRPEPVGLP